MAKATFKCRECGSVQEVTFEAGNPPIPPMCEKCKKEMKRVFKNMESGEVVDPEMLSLGQQMLYS